MATSKLFPLQIPNDYAMVVMVALSAFSFNFAQGTMIAANHRRKANIRYPVLYAPQEQANKDQAVFTYNCVQRAHANYMENLFPAMGSMMLGGLVHPRLAAGLGLTWVISRIVYYRGYGQVKLTDKPGTHPNPYFWLPQLALYATTFVGWMGPAMESVF